MTRRPLALALALAALALPHLVLAEPARIRVFEAPARAEPSREAAVLQLFPENAEVSVSEDAKDGWRRVRLPDGRVGWIEESALALAAKAPAANAAPAVPATPAPLAVPPPPGAVPPAPTAAAPNLHPKIYVKDLDHLAELVKEDPKVAPMADKLAARRKGAITVGVVGGLASVVAIGAGIAKMDQQNHDPSSPDFMKDNGSKGLFAGGIVGAVATMIVAGIVYPHRGDILDVINNWNVDHPDRPFEIEEHEVGHHR